MGLDADSSSLVAVRALEAAPCLLQQHGHLANVPDTPQQLLHGGGLPCPHTPPGHLGKLLHVTDADFSSGQACQLGATRDPWGGGGGGGQGVGGVVCV